MIADPANLVSEYYIPNDTVGVSLSIFRCLTANDDYRQSKEGKYLYTALGAILNSAI